MLTRREWVKQGALWVAGGPLISRPVLAQMHPSPGPGRAAYGGPSYVLDEGFEGTGTPSGWTTTGTTPAPNFDDTALFHDGAQSLKLDSTTASCTAISPAFSTGADVYGRFWWYNDHIHSTDAIIFQIRNGATEIGRIEHRGSGVLRVQALPGGSTSAMTLSTGEDSWKRIWFHYTQGSGANGTFRVWWATTDTHPGSGDAQYFAQSTNGTSTAQCDTVRLYSHFIGTTNGANNFDTLQISLSSLW